MNNINKWLSDFAEAWKSHNTNKVISLFSDNVEYWETPFKKLNNIDEVKSEWEYIKTQKNITLSTRVFSSIENKHSVLWELEYTNNEKTVKKFKGIYLIELDSDSKCTYFFHCCEQ